MGFHREQVRHAHAARARHPPEIVAQEIDDHEVFGPGLGIEAERARDRRLVLANPGARRRALHRPGLEQAPLVAQKQLRRAGQHLRRLAWVGPERERQQGPEGHRLAGAQPTVQAQGRPQDTQVEAVGVVDLVGFAGDDRLLDAGQGLIKRAAVQAGAQVADASGRRARQTRLHRGAWIPLPAQRLALAGRQPGRDRLTGQAPQGGKEQEPQGTALPRGQPGVVSALETHPPLEIRQHHRMAPRPHLARDLAPDLLQARGVVAPALARETGIEPARRQGLGGGTVIQQGENFHHDLKFPGKP